MMTYKETLLFIGKCLTITHEKHNRELVEQKLKSNIVDWDSVVKLSTSHYVFPALYCNLKRADLLHYLPADLVEYMKHITDLNRERNQQIIEEAKEINDLLLSNNITPIFLKGTGNLIEGLYEDIAERMVGDIDFLVDNDSFTKTITILSKSGYSKPQKNYIDNTILNRHYPKLTKKNKIGAIEIHYKMITNEKKFNYTYIKDSIKMSINKTHVLSYDNQLLLTCFNKQINDRGQWTKNIAFRNCYDVYLLSKLTNTKEVITNFDHHQSNYLNNLIASTNYFFNSPDSLNFQKTKRANQFVKKQLSLINNSKNYSRHVKFWEFYFLYSHRLSVIIKSFYKKEYRAILMQKLFNLPNS